MGLLAALECIQHKVASTQNIYNMAGVTLMSKKSVASVDGENMSVIFPLVAARKAKRRGAASEKKTVSGCIDP